MVARDLLGDYKRLDNDVQNGIAARQKIYEAVLNGNIDEVLWCALLSVNLITLMLCSYTYTLFICIKKGIYKHCWISCFTLTLAISKEILL